jgi:hypothetical protein
MFAMVAVLFVTACDNSTISTGDGGPVTEGNGKLKKEDRVMNGFNKIHIEGVFNVTLIQSGEEALSVESDENLLPLVITKVHDSILDIKLKDNISIKNPKKINVRVHLKNVNNILMKGVGMLRSAGTLNLKELKLENEGVGATALTLNVKKLDVKTESVGTLTLNGTALDVTINQNGVGLLKAAGLKANNLSLETKGIGASEVYAVYQMKIESEGLGSVSYKGDPVKKSIRSKGLGKISAMK